METSKFSVGIYYEIISNIIKNDYALFTLSGKLIYRYKLNFQMVIYGNTQYEYIPA